MSTPLYRPASVSRTTCCWAVMDCATIGWVTMIGTLVVVLVVVVMV